MNELATAEQNAMAELISEVVASPNSRRAYNHALANYSAFAAESGMETMTRASVMAWRESMRESGLSAATVNLRLSALKSALKELTARGVMEQADYASIASVPGVKAAGVRTGKWMNSEQAMRFLNSPPADSTIGLRDRALLALLLGCGCRREEAARLEVEQLETVDGVRVIRNLIGKGNRMRSLAIPPISDQRLQAWLDHAGISSGRVFRSVDQFGHIGGSLSADGLRFIVERRSAEVGMKIACHDVRRSYAGLCREGGAPLEEIQKSMGHSSLVVTQRYLDHIFEPKKAAGNYIAALGA